MQEPISIKISKAADMLGVSPSTITRWANKGDIRVDFTLGGQRRVPLSEVERLRSSQPLDRAERAERQTRAARETLAKKRGLTPHKAEYPPEPKMDASGLEVDDAMVVAFGEVLEQWRAARRKTEYTPEPVEGDGFDDLKYQCSYSAGY